MSGKITYFMDRDPYYFSKIIELIKSNDMDNTEFQKNIGEYSEQLVSELCFYKLLDNKYRPNPKLKLKRVVGFVNSSQHNNIIKIIIQNQIFETFESTLLKGSSFVDMLKNNKNNKIHMAHTNPKIFRHILNLLRSGNLYVHSNTIMEMLSDYGIEYDVIIEKKIDYDIVPCHNKYDVNISQTLTTTSQYIKNRYPDAINNMFIDSNNVIATESEMKFDSNIIFNLNDSNAHAVNDMHICIDIPVIHPTDAIEYIDLLEYRLIESVSIYFFDQKTSKTIFLMSTIPDYLYLYPELYTDNAKDYHQTTNIITKKMKLIYNDTLIDIHRVTLPLFLFESSHLPIKKMINNGILTQLIIKMAPHKKLFKNNKIKNISLLNISLLTTCENKLCAADTVVKPLFYMYERLHAMNIQVQFTKNPIYDIGTISLEGMGMIKDLVFTIITKDNNIQNTVNVFSENLIELEIICATTNTIYCVLDAIMMNNYIPLKKLGHALPIGIYYTSFSQDPRMHKFSGGVHGKDIFLRFKVKKSSEVIRLYVNEYHDVIF